MMNEQDLTLRFGEGIVNLRAGAIILKNGKILMTGNTGVDYLYSVGGRIRFGESAEEAVKREVWEETGVQMSVDRLGFIHECYFLDKDPGPTKGKLFYEISFYFYMKVPENFEPVCDSITRGGAREYLEWISPEDPRTYYREFLREELKNPCREIRHILSDER